MSHRHFAGIAVLVLMAGVGPAAIVDQATGQITGVVVAVREDDRGNDSLLLKTPSRIGTRAVDEIRLEVDDDTADDATSGQLPPGWTLEKTDDVLRLFGPPLAAGQDAYLRFDLGTQIDIDDLTLKLLSGSTELYDRTHDIERFPKLDYTGLVDDIVDLPGAVSPGETVEFTVRDIGRFSQYGLDTFGEWRVGASIAYEMPTADDAGSGAPPASDPPADGATPPTPVRYAVDLPYDLSAGLELKVGYGTKWDEAYLELPEGAGPEVVEPPSLVPDAPWIITCSPKAFAGNTVCVCGWFPDAASRNGLMVDGRPLGTAAAASNQSVRVTLPGDLAPGAHVITGNGVAGSAEIVVIGLGGSVDTESLFRGESTPIRLQITGTGDRTAITLRNHTPGIISLEGGDDQVITTSGGATNTWEGTVRGISPGNFNLTYSLDLSSCPCDDAELDVVADEPTAETAYDDTFRSYRRARDQANDAANETGEDARRRAQEALDELERTKKKLRDGIEAWNGGDEGGVGPATAATFTRYIETLETRVRDVVERPIETPEGDDPRDTPPPTSYGEEVDPPWITTTDGTLAPSQGVWQDDDYFADKATKQISRTSPTSWKAELDMVASRWTRVFGVRDDDHIRVKMSGRTTYTRLVPVRFRFTLVQGSTRTVIWTQPQAENHIPMDGPAGPEEPWAASLMTPEGVPRSFTMTPGPYTIEMELVRPDNSATGLKVTVAGNVVTTSFPTVHVVPVLLSNDSNTPLSSVVADTRRLATEAAVELPLMFPLPYKGMTVVADPPQDLRGQALDTVDRLVSLLPLTDTQEDVRQERLIAAMVQRFATGSSLTGGSKVIVVMSDTDFAKAYRRAEGVGGYAAHAKVMVLKMGSPAAVVGHELIHTLPYVWSGSNMQSECGFSYHNSADNDYGNGVSLLGYFATMRKGVDAVMGPVSGYPWITQCSYWHLLKQLQGAVDPELYLVSGFVGQSGGEVHGVLAPTYELEDTSELTAGPLTPDGWGIVLRDAGGRELATYPFEVVWQDPDADSPRSIVAFTHRVDRIPGTASIELVGPGGRKDVQTVSANAPTLQITSPTAGALVAPTGGTVRIDWQAEDADGDPLTYLVFFSPDGGKTWRLEADELNQPGFDLTIRGSPVGPRVRVIATDGVRSATAEVGFTIRR